MVAVGTASTQVAEITAAGHAGSAAIAFVLAMFAIVVTWLSFSWFAMRVAMVLQWARVARQAEAYRAVALANIRWITIVAAGTGLTFGMWWVYFATPFGEALDRRRDRGYVFGYGHIPLFLGIAGAGAGLHVAGLYLEHHAELSGTEVALSLAAPVGLYLLMVYVLHTALLGTFDPFLLLLLGLTLGVLGLTLGVLALATGLSAAGVGVAACLLVVMLAPFVTVVGYETVGHRHHRRMLDALAGPDEG